MWQEANSLSVLQNSQATANREPDVLLVCVGIFSSGLAFLIIMAIAACCDLLQQLLHADQKSSEKQHTPVSCAELRSSPPCKREWIVIPVWSMCIVPDETLEPGRKFYAYHGTSTPKFVALFRGNSHRAKMRESPWGMMGRGVYCTTDFSKARDFGRYVLIIEFVPCQHGHTQKAGVVVKWSKDRKGTWRGRHNGVYVPAGSAAKRSEFCIRLQCVTGVWDWAIPEVKVFKPAISNGRELVEATARVFERYC